MKSLKLLSLLLALLCLSGCCMQAGGSKLVYSTDLDTWETVTDRTDLLSDKIFWEPGHTEVLYIRNTDNSGGRTLTLSFTDTFVAEGVLGNEIRLTQFLYVALVDNITEPLTDRMTARELAEPTACPISALGTRTLHEGITAIVIYMPESVRNEANYASEEFSTISLHIS